MNHKDTLIQKLNQKEASVVVLGLGYVGLPLAVAFGQAGFRVTGIDPTPTNRSARRGPLLHRGRER
jgi:2-polyprenyl-6-methoxyphenol hydroxylase-like FAD-dependent oxidoreductase